jgi:hypothetical protein
MGSDLHFLFNDPGEVSREAWREGFWYAVGGSTRAAALEAMRVVDQDDPDPDFCPSPPIGVDIEVWSRALEVARQELEARKRW